MSFEHEERIHLDLKYLRKPDLFPDYHPSHLKSGSDITVDPVAGEHYPHTEFVQMAPASVTLGKPVFKASIRA
jgi:hypothetical protein